MDNHDLKAKTKLFAIDMLSFLKTLPNGYETHVISKQLLRSTTSFAANYRAACRGRSKREFYAKLSIVVEETDETMFWLEILIESGMVNNSVSNALLFRATEFVKIFSKARKTISDQLNS